jgi:RNA polymerase sigma-70 factor (ECF subfamily)
MDEARFLPLFLRHERELAGFARALLPDWDAVDEALQEASVVMWRKIGQLRAAEEFLPWAKVILRFEALRHLRQVRRARLVLDESLLAMIAEEALEDEADEAEREQDALRLCLDEFPEEQRGLLLAPYLGEGKVKELAEQAGKTPNSLYKLLGRLRHKLHDCVTRRLATA